MKNNIHRQLMIIAEQIAATEVAKESVKCDWMYCVISQEEYDAMIRDADAEIKRLEAVEKALVDTYQRLRSDGVQKEKSIIH
jgi:hypothetical protein